MSKLEISGSKLVKTLRKEFKDTFGTEIRVYDGRKQADDEKPLSELSIKKEGILECRSSITAGSFENRMLTEFGLKVKVFTPDNWASVLDGISLATAAGIKSQITHEEMESLVSYQKVDHSDDKAKKSVIAGEYVIEIKESGHVDVVRVPRNAMGTMKKIAEEKGIQVDKKWNTQDLGRHLLKEFGDGTTAVFGDITIKKYNGGKIEIVETPSNTKKTLQDICRKVGYDYDKEWDTQALGRKLLQYLIDHNEDADKYL